MTATTLDPETTFITLGDAAERWNKNPRSIRRMISEGELPAVRIGGSIRIRLADVMRAEAARPIGNFETAR